MTIKAIPRLSARHSKDELATALDDSGCCLIDGAATPATMDEIALEMAPFASDSDKEILLLPARERAERASSSIGAPPIVASLCVRAS